MEDTDRINALHPFPVIVYAVSLALSVSFQQLRYSRIPSDQEDARQDFQACCDIMQELRRKWECADAMGSLAQKISHAIDHSPLLDRFRASQTHQVGKADGFTGDFGHSGNGSPTDRPGGQRPELLQSNDHSVNSQMILPGFEGMDLFPIVDDFSWINMDLDNPVSSDDFPMMSLSDPYGAC